MQKKRVLTAVALAALAAGTLTTAALAQMGEGMGRAGGDGPMLAQIFDTVDADKDGKITAEEFAAHRKARAASVDANNDGKLSAEEIAAMHMQGAQDRANARAARMIERMDADGDGLLSAAELASGQGGMPAAMFDRLDADGDGAVSKAEAEAAQARMRDHMQGRGGHHGGHFGGHGKGMMGWGESDD